MSPRTGRPTENPKGERITVRLDKESKQILEAYCTQKKIERAEGVRHGIKKLRDEIE